ncbi:MBL fold metallo-hydrolase [Sedimentitalea sp. CY04]|uniref:MBL fold metallo-hydrolase n=1 Tax=Parasedimentitalea denitrificans TaxID=2211118 RepID=A0ABX0W2Y7_9RHOB|nr:MBL fold metallo-hydrolase [Sedimentitalea sp. CY04]NIZ59703.1 MBL fold metallo-hydrolase [Sedimentitalea sp. CY04]
MFSRRTFLQATAAAVGPIAVLPFTAAADETAMEFGDGAVRLFPISHASLVIETPRGVIYVDPVGDPAQYAGRPPADLVLITHHHGDHLNNETLAAVMRDEATLISNKGAQDKMSGDLAARAQVIGNGEATSFGDIAIDAIAAYNTTEGRLKFHPQGRDNGYVLNIGGTRVYLSADTEDVPEMRALKDIDVALLCMNLPFTMDINAAASAVAEFKPSVVIPYHYRGRDGGSQDPIAFAAMLDSAIKVEQGDWYGKGKGMV